MKIGIVGLPNVGKSTLFNALTKAGAISSNFPFTTIEPNVGLAAVSDPRLDKLAEVFEPEKITPVTIKVVDIAGLIKGAAEGEGLGNAFLSHISEVDVILEVVRGFEEGNIVHVAGKIDPMEDIRTIDTELILKDLEVLSKRLDKLTGEEKDAASLAIERLDRGEPAGEEGKAFGLLTSKPILYLINGDKVPVELKDKPTLLIDAKLEQELSELEDKEQKELMESYGIKESALGAVTRKIYEMLGLITFFTAGKSEVRGWSITKGTEARGAAGKIHTDMERGFIAADVIEWSELVDSGSWERARELGKVRLEGRDYEMKDGDTVIFKFNV